MIIKINYCPILGCTGWEFKKDYSNTYSSKKKKNKISQFNEKIRSKV